MVAQRGQTLGQNPAYRPSDILPLFEGLSVSQICERGTGLSGWSFAVANLRDLFFPVYAPLDYNVFCWPIADGPLWTAVRWKADVQARKG